MVRMIKRGGRYLKGAALGKLGFCTSWAVSRHDNGPEWMEVVDVPLRIKNIPAAFKGKRIIQVSDLHHSRTVSSPYLKACIERINRLEADMVVITGDYVTYDYYGKFRRQVVELLEGVRGRHGVLACLGNHDYGMNSSPENRDDAVADRMVKELKGNGVNVLRNESGTVHISGQKLRFVGLGDIWVNDFDPDRAFKDVKIGDAVIVLSHNPESVELLHRHHADMIMSGHTHGVGLGFKVKEGKHKIAINNYCRGMYKVGTKKLYVNRGLGRHGKIFYNSRPEITVFNLC